MKAYSDPTSITFSNCYQSARVAGYTDLTARNLSHLQPRWLSESIGQIVQSIKPEQLTSALSAIVYDNSEPTIVRLRAIDLMMKYYGLYKQTYATTGMTISVDLTGAEDTPKANDIV